MARLTEHFRDAMDRHWQDAELLHRKERLANADHLYGLSAECGLKALLEQDGNRIEGRTRCVILINSGESVEALRAAELSQPRILTLRTTLFTTGALMIAMLIAVKSGVGNCSGTA